ncbi:DUF1189 family protein [Heyndrickxia acidiproducens]|uniref:DUF1189 family protein n=1 Tax=Heyndrickxia acidiproducens TaxID=1121084 RepID=UPI00035C7BF8|nr:DUF1189 family protein [Heyndrickxia acidiproducens]
MNLWRVFINSCLLPGKKAAFRLNRVRMDVTILYIFILVFLVSVPRGIEMAAGGSFSKSLSIIQFIFYFLLMYYLLAVLLMLAGISLLSACGCVLRRIMQRKLAYQHLWKMSAYMLTVPLMLYTILNGWAAKNGLATGFLLGIYPLAEMIWMIRMYPKTTIKQKQAYLGCMDNKEGENNG